MKRYQSLAKEFSKRIEEGTLLPGDRLPSVRKVSRGRRVSPATVLRAYRMLEDGGRIETRARSGHYVSAHWRAVSEKPQISLPRRAAIAVDVKDLVFELLETVQSRAFVSLGSAFPGPEHFPHAKLASALHASARKLDPRSIYDHLPLGNLELRRLISRRYMEWGCDVPMEEIVITSGALEALNLSVQAVTRPGDLVAIECPAFYVVLEAMERLGLKAVEVPTHPRDGMSVPALAEVLRRHSVKACWLMTSFQNPLGSSMPEDSKRALVKLLAARDIPLIEDDVYAELYFGKEQRKPAKAFDRGGRVLHCGSFSKCLAPGYRVGWVAPGRHARQVERAKMMTTIATSVPTQAAIVEFLKHGGYGHHLRRLRRALAANQERMLEAIGRHFPAGTRVTTPAGGYFLWVEMPANASAMEVHRLAFDRKITVAPGPLFSPQRKFENCLRLNHGLAWSPKIDAAIVTLGKIVGSL
ncbi:MAG: aminotransferase-like domain-containing protein [Usitatibacter sp.]